MCKKHTKSGFVSVQNFWERIKIKKSHIQNTQKILFVFVNFVHTCFRENAIIILVKTPNTFLFLLYPIVKIPSPKRQLFYSCLLTLAIVISI